jgi:hypothetical protein
LAAVLAFVLASCEERREGPAIRRELFQSSVGDPVAEELKKPARLTILYHPDIIACAPVELKVIRALNRLAADDPEIRILTILPRGTDTLRERYGQKEYAKEGEISPRPRLEVWSGRRLLLLKSVPGVATEDSVYEEILWTRSFTRPLPRSVR